ncbi:MAG: hypothetical protein WBD24_03845 [Candidatus Omnitrophota bacterium]
MKKDFFLFLLIVSFLISAGCADVDLPNTGQIIKNPLGPGSVKIGMLKDKVVDIYGEPDIKGTVTSDKWIGTREEWIYWADLSTLPVGAGYLGQDLYIYFDGDNVTNLSNEPLGKESKNAEKTSR